MDYKLKIAESIHLVLSEDLTKEDIYSLLERPKLEEHGDLAFPTFQLARIFKKNPKEIASDLAGKISSDLVDQVEAVGPYLNFHLNRKTVSSAIIQEILDQDENYGDQSVGQGQNVPIDMSSPNIAKPMSMGHLRSTVIGNALANIMEKMGFNPFKINHLGDWGTQFGKLIYAYKTWGDPQAIEEDPIPELLRIYVKFHEEAEDNPELEDQGRLWFAKLEQGDSEALELWEKFRALSLEEFNKIYQRLNVEFDSYNGEAFYNDKMDQTIELIENSGKLVEDQGAQIIKLDKYDLNPALIKKKDGSTLYITRDIAAAIYRKKEYDFAQALYVVGQEQANHFKQLKGVLQELGFDWAQDIHHIPFGLITKDGQKLSTRKGKLVLLEDVLDEASKRALEQIEDKNPDLANKEEIADQVGVGAVVFHDLKNDRMNNFDFTIDEVVQFEGETGPYVQYSRVRALSILENSQVDLDPKQVQGLEDDHAWSVVKLLEKFPNVLSRASKNYDPSLIAKHVIDLSQAFNKYYANVRVLDEDGDLTSRLALVKAVEILIKINLNLLGLSSPSEM